MSPLTALRHGVLWTSVATLILCGVVSPDASRQAAPLNLVSTAWAPFTNAAGLPRFALDLVEDALGRTGLTAKTTIVSAPQFTSSLLSDQFDGSAAAWKDSARERALVFSQPYLENRLVLVGRRGADVSAKKLTELADKRVAIVDGYSYGDAIELAGPVFMRTRSEEDSLTQLLKGTVEYTLIDELVVHHIVGIYPNESRDEAADRFDGAAHATAVFCRQPAACRCRIDHRPFQRRAPRDDGGSDLPSGTAGGLDSR